MTKRIYLEEMNNKQYHIVEINAVFMKSNRKQVPRWVHNWRPLL